MGKLELSHFSERPEKKASRRGTPKREEAANAERFGSLVEGNPFKIAGEEVRRNRRRNARTRNSAQENNNSKVSSPILQSRINTPRLQPHVPAENQIISRRVRNTVPDLHIDEDSVFPELGANIGNQHEPIAAKETPTPAAQSTSNKWSKSGKDVIKSASSSKVKSPTDSVSLGPVRPGWVRISRNGYEYGPRSEHYERLLLLQQQTTHIIHREFFARSSRMMNDGYDDDRYDGGFFSDDDAGSDYEDIDYDARNSDDDGDSDDDY